MKQYDVVALGELLIDFTEQGKSEQGNPAFEANPGGAPCNVLAMLSRLSKKTAFIGKVGKDMFGDQLEAALLEAGIDASGLKRDEKIHTTLAFVHTKEDGDRTFSFCRNPGADVTLCEEDLEEGLLKNCSIFHFGSLSMTHEASRKATIKAVSIAREHGAVISYDPNLREALWDDLNEAKTQISFGLEHCDILKISDNEVQWLTGESDYDKGIFAIQERYQIPLILLSMGKDGSRAYAKEVRAEWAACLQSGTIETTGAGDTFCACVLNYVLEHGRTEFSKEELEEMLRFANAAAAIVTTRKGALRVMPQKAEVEALLG